MTQHFATLYGYEKHSNFKKKHMNTTALLLDWEEQKGKLKEKFAKLTDNDLLYIDGKKEEMIGKLETKLGKTKDELNKILAEL